VRGRGPPKLWYKRASQCPDSVSARHGAADGRPWCPSPLARHGVGTDPQYFRDFLDTEASEKTSFHNLAFAMVEPCQAIERALLQTGSVDLLR
jgi:hypothetical protein